LGTEKWLTQAPSVEGALAASAGADTEPQPQDFSHELMIRLSYQVQFWQLKTI
jgi:hypothetical protein|tara:strand:+ start:464 stop:622 length:159 start_codon:yes stop_codon:yes gene_type:complete